MAVFILLLASIGCGGGGSSSAVTTYDGNTDPAVADSTTATPLAQAGLDASSAGFPVVQAFFMEEPVAAPVAAPLAPGYDGTYVIMQIPSDAIIDGADLGGGGGTMTLAGSILMWVEDRSAGGATWTIANATMNGSITFNGYYNGMGSTEEQLTGTVSVSDTSVVFSNDPVEIPLADIGPAIVNYIDFPIFTDVAITFTHLTVGTGADSYSLGEGDMEITLGVGYVDVIVNSLAAEGGGESVKLEDSQVYVLFGPGGADITIEGDVDYYATVYHSTLGKFYFHAAIIEDDTVGDIVSGSLEVSEDGIVEDFYFDLALDSADRTFYNSFTFGGTLVEKGWLDDWEFIPDAGAPDIT